MQIHVHPLFNFTQSTSSMILIEDNKNVIINVHFKLKWFVKTGTAFINVIKLTVFILFLARFSEISFLTNDFYILIPLFSFALWKLFVGNYADRLQILFISRSLYIACLIYGCFHDFSQKRRYFSEYFLHCVCHFSQSDDAKQTYKMGD